MYLKYKLISHRRNILLRKKKESQTNHWSITSMKLSCKVIHCTASFSCDCMEEGLVVEEWESSWLDTDMTLCKKLSCLSSRVPWLHSLTFFLFVLFHGCNWNVSWGVFPIWGLYRFHSPNSCIYLWKLKMCFKAQMLKVLLLF